MKMLCLSVRNRQVKTKRKGAVRIKRRINQPKHKQEIVEGRSKGRCNVFVIEIEAKTKKEKKIDVCRWWWLLKKIRIQSKGKKKNEKEGREARKWFRPFSDFSHGSLSF